jgi:uncharacterized damage-inducible protein DinB
MKDSESSRLADFAMAIRGSTMKRLRSVPPGHENWRPTADSLSIADIAQHLIDADQWLFAKLADPSLPSIKAVAGSAVIASRSEFEFLLDRLEQLGSERARLLSELSASELEQAIQDDRFGGPVSVWWVIVRGNLDHEAHHRGQLATYIRIIRTGTAPEGSSDVS